MASSSAALNSGCNGVGDAAVFGVVAIGSGVASCAASKKPSLFLLLARVERRKGVTALVGDDLAGALFLDFPYARRGVLRTGFFAASTLPGSALVLVAGDSTSSTVLSVSLFSDAIGMMFSFPISSSAPGVPVAVLPLSHRIMATAEGDSAGERKWQVRLVGRIG
jgi:hypothetical protein